MLRPAPVLARKADSRAAGVSWRCTLNRLRQSREFMRRLALQQAVDPFDVLGRSGAAEWRPRERNRVGDLGAQLGRPAPDVRDRGVLAISKTLFGIQQKDGDSRAADDVPG